MNANLLENIRRQVLARVDGLDILELIDYHPEMIQRVGNGLRAACPIHRDGTFRTLTVDNEKKVFRCASVGCPGSNGGDLLDLYAKTKGLEPLDAAKSLSEEFGFELIIPVSHEEADGTLESVGQILDMPERGNLSAEKLEQARLSVARVLEAQPDNLTALEMMVHIHLHTRDADALAEATLRLIDTSKAHGVAIDIEQTLNASLEVAPENARLQTRMVDLYLEQGRTDEAAGTLMVLADNAEARGDYPSAILAYRKMEETGVVSLDVHPFIVQLYVAQGNIHGAVLEIIQHADRLLLSGEAGEAREALLGVFEYEPENDAARSRLIRLDVYQGCPPEAIRAALEHVDAMITHGRNEPARDILKYILEVDPECTLAVERLARVAFRVADYKGVLEHQFRLVDMYRRRDDLSSSIAVLEEILVTHPDNTEALTQLARAHESEGDREQAVSALRRLLDIHRQAGREEDVASTFAEMRRVDPKNDALRDEHADHLLATGRHPEALAALLAIVEDLEGRGDAAGVARRLEAVIRIDPSNPSHYLQRAAALAEMGDLPAASEQRLVACRKLLEARALAEAETQLRLLLDIDEHHTGALTLLSEVLTELRRPAEAATTLHTLARVHRKAGNPSAAREVLESLLRLDADDSEAAVELASLCEELGDEKGLFAAIEAQVGIFTRRRDYERALQGARRLQEMRPNDIAGYRKLIELNNFLGNKQEVNELTGRLAEMFRELGDFEAEREVLEEILLREPANLDSRERLILILIEEGERSLMIDQLDTLLATCKKQRVVPRATRFLRELILRTPEEPQLHVRLLQALEASGENDDAVVTALTLIGLYERRGERAELIPLYRRILRHQPENTVQRSNLIKELLRDGETADAIEEYRQLADRYTDLQRYEDAESAWNEVLRIDPSSEEASRRLAELQLKQGRTERAVEILRALSARMAAVPDVPRAIAVLREILGFSPDNRPIRRELIDRLVSLGDSRGAVEELERLGEAYSRAGDEEASLSLHREAITLFPQEITLRTSLVDRLEGMGRNGEAVVELYALCKLHQDAGRNAEALECLERITRVHPDDLKARRTRGEIFVAMGDEKKALLEFMQLSAMVQEARPPAATAVEPARPLPSPQLSLMKEYDFDSFVVGDRNNFAHATALAIARAPGTSYNPLFLYADVGLGKTHLMHAIANAVLKANPAATILYTNSEDFTSELIDAIQNNTIIQFRNKHKSVDMLLLDDVQFLAGKERSQEEFFHIFNTLFQAKRQIIVTSDRPPKDITHLEKRLKSRFGAGVVVDIQPPDYETRLAILRREANRFPDLDVHDVVIEVIAKRIDTNVRELKGAFNQLMVAHQVSNAPLSPRTAAKIVEKLAASR